MATIDGVENENSLLLHLLEDLDQSGVVVGPLHTPLEGQLFQGRNAPFQLLLNLWQGHKETKSQGVKSADLTGCVGLVGSLKLVSVGPPPPFYL